MNNINIEEYNKLKKDYDELLNKNMEK